MQKDEKLITDLQKGLAKVPTTQATATIVGLQRVALSQFLYDFFGSRRTAENGDQDRTAFEEDPLIGDMER